MTKYAECKTKDGAEILLKSNKQTKGADSFSRSNVAKQDSVKDSCPFNIPFYRSFLFRSLNMKAMYDPRKKASRKRCRAREDHKASWTEESLAIARITTVIRTGTSNKFTQDLPV